jgi:hypothetical protein
MLNDRIDKVIYPTKFDPNKPPNPRATKFLQLPALCVVKLD